MIVDVNSHWVPANFFTDKDLLDAFVRTVPRAYGENVVIETIPGTNRPQVTLSRPKGYENVASSDVDADLVDQLKAMDDNGIDKSVKRVAIFEEWITLELAKLANDAMARVVKEHPDRLLGLGMVPPWGDKACLYEMDRCIKELGLAGFVCPAHYGVLYLDAMEVRPFFKKVNELDVPICVHHTALPVDYEHIYEFPNFRRLYGRCMDQMISVGRILFSGMLNELPNLKLIHTFLGGAFFAYADLLVPKKSEIKEVMAERFDPNASEKIRGYLDRNIYFDISHAPPWGKAQLECAVKVLGADHVLFGSSYPLRRDWLYNGVDYVKNLDITEKEKSLILGENAIRLFKI